MLADIAPRLLSKVVERRAAMLERRVVRRNRVCLEGSIACGLTGPIRPVRIRNLSGAGAEIVVSGGQLPSLDVELAIPRRDYTRKARVVWRSMDRFGLRFVSDRPVRPADGDTEAPSALMDRLLAGRPG